MTGTIVVACIGSAGTVLAAMVYRRVGQVHVLVNSRLDTALAQIKDLQQQRDLKRQDDQGAAGERMARPENHQG